MVERETRPRRSSARPRAFALIIVLIIALAAALIAATMLASASSTRVATQHSKNGEVADVLAAAGMQRSNAYLNTVLLASGDFDLALDPALAANCAGLPAAPTCAGVCNRPDFTDGAAVTYNGKTYTRVALNGGAYLVRYDDNSDDQRTESKWANQTGNHAAGGCVEGPTAIAGGGDNPLRDRDRTVLVTVIGIAPGTNPATATHRTTLRKLFNFRTDPTVAFEAGGNLDAGGGTTKLELCSTISGANALGNFQSGSTSRTCTCGDSHANNVGSWNGCQTMGGSLCNTAATCTAATRTTPAPTSITTWSDTNFDWNSPCNFWVEKGTTPSTFILWVWDPLADRGPSGSCSGYTGSFAGAGPPNITAGAIGSYQACWTPLVINDTSGADPCVSVFAGAAGADNVDNVSGRCEWRPLGGAASVIPGTGPAPSVAASFALVPSLAGREPTTANNFNKPDWVAQCTIGFPGQARTACTSCDGTNNAFEDSTGAFGEYYISGGPDPGINSVPAGAYYYPGNLTLGTTEQFGGASAPASGALDLNGMPLATIVVQGNLTINGNHRGWFGAGHALPDGNLPALVVYGNISMAANPGVLRIAGSIWAGGSFTWADTGAPATRPFDGDVHVAGNVSFNGGNTFLWQYFNPLQPVTQSSLPSAPLTFISSE